MCTVVHYGSCGSARSPDGAFGQVEQDHLSVLLADRRELPGQNPSTVEYRSRPWLHVTCGGPLP